MVSELATLEFMKDTVKKDSAEGCEYVGAV
jgi:hypothetical protein